MHKRMLANWKALHGKVVIMQGQEVELQANQYDNGRLAILAVTVPEQLPFCKLTANLPEEKLTVDQFFVRCDTVDEDLARVAQAAGLIKPCTQVVGAGLVKEYARKWELC